MSLLQLRSFSLLSYITHVDGFACFVAKGFVGLFRGCTPTLLGILPYAGIAYALNEQGKRKVSPLHSVGCV